MAVARHARGGHHTRGIGSGSGNIRWMSRCCTFMSRGRGEESTQRGRWSDVTSDVWAWHRDQHTKRCSHNPYALPTCQPPRSRMSAASPTDPALDFAAASHPGRRETLHTSKLVEFMRGFDRSNACPSLDAENCSCFARSNPNEHPDHAQATILGGPFTISFSRSPNRRQYVILDRSTQRILKIDPTQ